MGLEDATWEMIQREADVLIERLTAIYSRIGADESDPTPEEVRVALQVLGRAGHRLGAVLEQALARPDLRHGIGAAAEALLGSIPDQTGDIPP